MEKNQFVIGLVNVKLKKKKTYENPKKGTYNA